MLKEEIGFLKYRDIIKKSNNNIFNDIETGRMIKLDKDSAREMKKRKSIRAYTPGIDPDQIQLLSEKQACINNTFLPSGVIYYHNLPIAVIYPKFFDNYKTFEDLHNEDESIIINNLKAAFYNNLELINNNIYNSDFAFKNVMYKDNSVELIDLDGKYIGNKDNFTISEVYYYYLYDLYYCIERKLKSLDENYKNEQLEELKKFIYKHMWETKIDSPLQVIEEIEKKRILK